MATRVLFVTGKGGTGKSRVAEALARSAGELGRPAILMRTSGAGTVTRPGRGKGRGAAAYREIALDEEGALGDFLTRALRFAFLARRLRDTRTFSAVAAAAPGLRDLVRLTSITRLVETTRPNTVVVVDAPATGHSVALLAAPGRVLEFATFGPVERDAREALRVIGDAATFTPVLVTTPEELAITEVLSLRDQLVATGIAPARIVVNGLWPAYVDDTAGRLIESCGASVDAARHWRRRRRQAELVALLEAEVGPCTKVAFTFVEGGSLALGADDVRLLLDGVEGTPA